jgi:hypothetical protein
MIHKTSIKLLKRRDENQERSKNISTHVQHLTLHQYFSNPRLFFYHLPSSTHKHETRNVKS